MPDKLIVTTDSPLETASEQPRNDLVEIAKALPADVYRIKKTGRGIFGKLNLARQLFFLGTSNRGRSGIISASELIGLPLAAGQVMLRRRHPHILIGHKLYTQQRLALLKRTSLIRYISRIVVITREQQKILRDNLPANYRQHILYHPHSVDDKFFTPSSSTSGDYILSVGLELRDYVSLIPALAKCGLPARILASSAWAPKGTRMYADEWPGNVSRLSRLSFTELRLLYDRARFVVLPLVPTVQGAGATAALEAMAMGKAVIASNVPGIVDYVQDQVNGILVPPENSDALAQAIEELWANSTRAIHLGQAGRKFAEHEFSLDQYVSFFAQLFADIQAG